jgi:hypothetical protein
VLLFPCCLCKFAYFLTPISKDCQGISSLRRECQFLQIPKVEICFLRLPPGFPTVPQLSTRCIRWLRPFAAGPYQHYKGGYIIDNCLKHSIFIEVDMLLKRKLGIPSIARKISLPKLHASTRNRRSYRYFFL